MGEIVVVVFGVVKRRVESVVYGGKRKWVRNGKMIGKGCLELIRVV